MKNFTLILTLISTFTFSQTQNNSVDIKTETNNAWVQAANMKAEGEGISYIGSGTYRIQQTGKTDISSYKRQVKKAKEKILSFVGGQGYSYKIINEEKDNVPVGYGVARTVIKFKMFDKNGNVVISEIDKKDNRKKIIAQLKELKELLDLGILTKEEYDKSANELKKILLEDKFE